MSDLLPANGQTRTLLPRRRGWLQTASRLCILLFLLLIVVAAVTHPHIPDVVLSGFVVLPVAAIVTGVIAHRRASPLVKVAVVSLVLVLAISFLLPNLCRAREPANRVKCASNLKQIGLALAAYVDRHGGQYPPGLDTLVADPENEITADVLVCPSTQDVAARGATPQETGRMVREGPQCLSYVYVGAGLSKSAAGPDRVVAYDKPHNHGDNGINVLYGDGHVDFLPWKEARRAIPDLEIGPDRPTARPG